MSGAPSPSPLVLLDLPDTPAGMSIKPRGWPRLKHFDLEREIGRGSMGRVYLAQDRRTGQHVALKTLRLGREFEGFALEEAVSRFGREAEAARALHHPDMVRVFETGQEDEVVYIVMEWIRGQELSIHAHPGSLLPVPQVVDIGARVASALAHAHRQGVIHRDIKPSNVMYDAKISLVKVMDFGIARVVDGARTRTGLVLGSPLYMAPEQLLGRPVDGRSDLYGLGVTLFQLLSGRVPLQGQSMPELIQAVTHTEPPDLRRLRPDLPQVLCDVVALLLEKRPELRYRTGTEVAQDLQYVARTLQSVQDVSATAKAGSTECPV